jgi:hypothetical protein
MSGNYKLDVDEIINPVSTADQHATVAPAPAPATAIAKGGARKSVNRSRTWRKPTAKHGAALLLLSLVAAVILAVYASSARNSTAGLASVLLVSCGLCLIVGDLCLTKASQVISTHAREQSSGKDFMQNLGLAISCAQIFFVVIRATKNLLPELCFNFVLNLAIFSLDLTLAPPSLQQYEVDWVQFILQLLVCVGCLFLWFGDVDVDDDDDDNDDDDESKPPKKLAKLPWQDIMDRFLLGRTTPAILLGVFVAGIVLAGSSFGLGAALVAKVHDISTESFLTCYFFG